LRLFFKVMVTKSYLLSTSDAPRPSRKSPLANLAATVCASAASGAARRLPLRTPRKARRFIAGSPSFSCLILGRRRLEDLGTGSPRAKAAFVFVPIPERTDPRGVQSESSILTAFDAGLSPDFWLALVSKGFTLF
jgi:hypothetical protein